MQLAQTLKMDIGSKFYNETWQNKKAEQTYRAALYVRLSREDGNSESESMSIQSQKIMLTNYAHEHGFEIADYYIDDGCTGTNFDRPNFQRMIKDIKLNRINMVITKDLSRLGRNYVMIGQYRDYFFPEFGVRYIALNDNYDSDNEDNDIAPFKDVLNEMYARDISKKIRSSRKVAAQQGKFMGSMPSYGYKRSATDKHKLEIDETAAQTIRRIFELFKSHESARHIADKLNKEGVLTPQNYYYQSIGQENPYNKNANTWCSSTIIGILKKEVYIGQMVQSKRAVQSFKTKKVQNLPQEMWVIVENTHEPIIDLETWNAVQLMFETNKNNKTKKRANGEVSLFANIIRCKDCGSKLSFSSRYLKSGIDSYYRCSHYLQHSSVCTPHRIDYEKIYSIVLQDIRNNARLAIEDEEEFLKNLRQISLSAKNSEIREYIKRETHLKNRLKEIDILIQKSFEKNVAGLLPDNMLTNLLQTYQQDRTEAERELYSTRKQKLIAENTAADLTEEVSRLKRYSEITELNRTIVSSLIQSIHISEPRRTDGRKEYDIEIRYKFQPPHCVTNDVGTSATAKKEDTIFDDMVSLDTLQDSLIALPA